MRAEQHIALAEVLVLDGSRTEDRANVSHVDVTFTGSPPIGSLLSMQV